MAIIKFASFNTRGLLNNEKRKTIFQYFKQRDCDIVLLQETHSKRVFEHSWRSEWKLNGSITFSHSETHDGGVLCLFKNKLKDVTSTNIIPGRMQKIKLEINDAKLIIYNIHAPDHDKDQITFFQKLQNEIANDQDFDTLLLGGDFNVVMNHSMDKKNGTNIKKKCIADLKNIIQNFNLDDIWRKKNPTKKSFTWSQRTPFIECRLDYFFIQTNMTKNVKGTDIDHLNIKSDHRPIYLDLDMTVAKRGPGYWKFNNSLLKDEQFRKQIDDLINIVWENTDNISDVHVRYELLKFEIQRFSRKYANQKSKLRKSREKELKKELDRLYTKIQNKTITDNELNAYDTLKTEHENILEYIATGNQIRSRIQEIEFNEKSNNYFFGREKYEYDKKTLGQLNDEDGNIITDKCEIQKQIKRFYENLYTSKYSNEPDFTQLENLHGISKLSQNEKDKCENPITEDECYKTIKLFQNNKSPGVDGLSKEFYETFWPKLKNKLLAVYNQSLEKGYMTTSQRQAIITILHKKGKDPALIKSYRPISLLCFDYKLYSKILARRLVDILPKVISEDQFGFVKGRHIGSCIRFVQDIIDYTDLNNIPGIILQLDFEKAFDTIEHKFIWRTLEKFNFGPKFIQMVKLCYNNIETAVLNNGYNTGWFKPTRGIRQGCPLSGTLFILVGEILAQLVRNNEKINGINIEGLIFKLKQFADDTTAFLRNWPSVVELFKVTKDFRAISGLSLNQNKTLIFWLGPWRTRTTNPLFLGQCGNTMSTLGISVGRNLKEQNLINFNNKIHKIENTFSTWNQRNLSLLGKILVIKSQAMSNIIYSLSNIQIENTYLEQMQKNINRFVWGSNYNRVKHSTMIADYDKAGLRMPDVKCTNMSLRLPWLGRILEFNSWSFLPTLKLKPYGGLLFLLKCDYDPKHFRDLPTFYTEMLTFASYILFEPHSIFIIWNNKNIKIGGKTIYWHKWKQKGVMFVQDLRHSNRWLTLNEFKVKFSIECDFLRYRGFIAALNTYWPKIRDSLNHNDLPRFNEHSTLFRTTSGCKIDIAKAKAREYYQILLENNIETPKALIAWEVKGIREDLFYSSMVNARASTKEQRLLSTQYKILHDVWPTRRKLYQWKLRMNDECFCSAVDTITHTLYDCNETKDFLRIVLTYIDNTQNILQRLEFKFIIFGVENYAINMILLLMKWYVVTQRVQEKRLNFNSFKVHLYTRIIAEKQSMPPYKFAEKWRTYEWLVRESDIYNQQFEPR